MPAATLEEITKAERDYARNPRDSRAWKIYAGQGRFLPKQQDAAKPVPFIVGVFVRVWSYLCRLFRRREILLVEACLEHYWPNGSAAVSIHHQRIGWLEFDLTPQSFPSGAEPGSSIPVSLYLDAKGNVVRHQVSPGAKVILPPAKESTDEALGSRLPKPPMDWNDVSDVARYDHEHEEWKKRSSLGKESADSE